jgi:hypothetical protein
MGNRLDEHASIDRGPRALWAHGHSTSPRIVRVRRDRMGRTPGFDADENRTCDAGEPAEA